MENKIHPFDPKDNPRKAAELLEMNVSTLNSRIKKLGIEKPGQRPNAF